MAERFDLVVIGGGKGSAEVVSQPRYPLISVRMSRLMSRCP